MPIAKKADHTAYDESTRCSTEPPTYHVAIKYLVDAARSVN